jgi:PAS domain S-box-containing protein
MVAGMSAADGPPDIIDLIHESVIGRDAAGHILSWNAASETLYGWPRDEALGRDADELLKTRHPAPLAELEALLLADGRWEGELSRVTASGAERILDVRWSVERDEAGGVARIIETARDITDRKAAEDALRLSEYRYRNMFEAMAVGFWEIDFNGVGAMLLPLRAEGVTDLRAYLLEHRDFTRRAMKAARVVDVNEKALEMFGAARDEIVGRDISAYWPEASEPVFIDALAATMGKEPHLVTETTLLTPSGARLDVLFTVSWSAESRKRGVVLLGIIDIGERNRAISAMAASELKYRNLFHHMPISLWQLSARGLLPLLGEARAQGVTDLAAHMETNPDFIARAMDAITIEEVNELTVRMFGGADKADFVGPITRFWQDRPDTIRRSLAARFSGKDSHVEETSVRGLDGRSVDILFASAFPPALAELGITIVGAVDISERNRAQAALQGLQAEFAHAARVSMLGEFTASIAHEVNQPLAAIVTNGEAGLRWLKRDEPDLDEMQALTGRIVADARRAADIIARIRAMAEHRAPKREPLALDAVIGEALAFMRHETQTHGVTLELDLAPGLPPVLGDRTQIQQVIVNLAMNAVQAMHGGDCGTRVLRVRTAAGAGETLNLVVEDTGPGFGEAPAGRLFDSFYTTKTAGMGMGLPICRSILEAHGGTIEAEEGVEGGARFTVVLPARS